MLFFCNFNDENFAAKENLFDNYITGKCAPGWMLEEEAQRCYKYMGAALPYNEANDFCKVNTGC